jgi:polyhydroxybutyrate depolymerase
MEKWESQILVLYVLLFVCLLGGQIKKMKYTLFFLFLLQNIDSFALEQRSVTVQGRSRIYLIHIPKTKNPDKPLPLVLMLHGTGGSAENSSRYYGWIEKAEQESFTIVFGEGTPRDPTQPAHQDHNPNIWNDGFQPNNKNLSNDTLYLQTVIDNVANSTPIDRKRIFCTGFSNGASMCFRAGVELSQSIAAIAPVSGNLWLSHPKPARPISMMLITGDADLLNPIHKTKANTATGHIRNVLPPIFTTINKWLRIIGARPESKEVVEAKGIKLIHYGKTASGKEVFVIILAGQKHDWPGRDIIFTDSYEKPPKPLLYATETIWDFFKSQ